MRGKNGVYSLIFLTCGFLWNCGHGALCDVPAPRLARPPWFVGAEDMTTQQWSTVLLRGVANVCSGAPLPLPKAGDAKPLPTPQHVLQKAGKNYLVWLQTHRMDDGQLTGPLALIGATGARTQVTAMGLLAAPVGPIALSVVQENPLVVAVESIDLGGKETLVSKRLHLYGVQSHRFIAFGPQTIHLLQEQRCNNAQVARLATSLEHSGDVFTLREKVSVHQTSGAKALLSEGDSARQIRWDGLRWHESAPSLWSNPCGDAASL